jgi:hypothetical protein
MFVDAITYPFRQGGWLMIVLGAIFAVILDLMSAVPVLGLGVALFSAGYFGSFYLQIVNSTMTGRDQLPDWPSFSSFWDDIILPFFRLTLLVVFAFWPVVAIAIVFAGDEHAASIGVLAAVVFGCAYFPMAVLAAQAFGGVTAALPHIVIPAMFKAMPGYLLALISLILVFVVAVTVQQFAGTVPYLGWLLTAAVGLYSLMFQARLIGLIYVEKQHVLGWE